MKNDTKKTGNGTKTATAQLAELNRQIEELKLQKTALAEPLKQRHAELRSELLQVETEIRDLDPSWKPASLRPRADDKIAEVITAHDSPMTAEEIIAAVGNVFSPWKIKNTLKKRSTGPKAVFTVNDGRYAVKTA
jgi:DNA repair exonuclease SbcCD ATPase subunit